MSTNVSTNSKTGTDVRKMVLIAMLGAVSMVLMIWEIPLPFAPEFYKIDLSEVPVMIGCFALGPVAGAVIELIKILLNFAINGTITAGVGEFANFLIGCGLCVPAGIIYRRNRTRKGAVVGMAVGTVFMTIVGCLLNAFVLLPTYSKLMGLPLDNLVAMGSAVNPAISSISTFVMFAVVPFNLLKGILVSVIVFVIYKKVSVIFRMK